jgi:hypothetical protein
LTADRVVNGVLAGERQTGAPEYPSARGAVPTMSS